MLPPHPRLVPMDGLTVTHYLPPFDHHEILYYSIRDFVLVLLVSEMSAYSNVIGVGRF